MSDLRTRLISNLFHHLDRDGSLQVGYCAEEASRTIEGMPLPLDVKRLLQRSWTKSGGKVGAYDLYSVKEILANDDLPRLLVMGMLQIGIAANGDLLVLRFTEEECAVGLVSHDEFWAGESDEEDVYAEVTGSIDEFLWRASEGRFLPTDYYDAIELVEMRREVDGR
jgi:hypothetical protein